MNEKPGDDAANGAGRARRNKQLQDAIAALVRDIPRGVHLTAPEVYRRARDSGLEVSLSTVYRTLNQLQAHGDVTAVSGDHGRRYEARDDGHDHDHLICLKCGLTVEFADDLIRGFGKAVAERKGYDHHSSRFDIYGICGTCRSKDEDHRAEVLIKSVNESLSVLSEIMEELNSAVSVIEARKISKGKEMISAVISQLHERIIEELENAVSFRDDS
ncbi:MAG: transcriptional repressor [Candidatus Obscuribacterales bacterium]